MIETNRCILSKIQKIDYEDVKMLYTDERVRQFLGGIIEENIYTIKFNNMCDESLQAFYEKLGMMKSQGMICRNYKYQCGREL